MKRTVLGALILALTGWVAIPVEANAQGVVVTRQVYRPDVRRTVVVTRPDVRRTVVVTRPVVRRDVVVTRPVFAPGIVVGRPVVSGRVVVGGPCRTVTRQVRSAGRVVSTTNRVCS